MKSGGGESEERQTRMDPQVNVGRLRQERMGNGLTKWVWNVSSGYRTDVDRMNSGCRDAALY